MNSLDTPRRTGVTGATRGATPGLLLLVAAMIGCEQSRPEPPAPSTTADAAVVPQEESPPRPAIAESPAYASRKAASADDPVEAVLVLPSESVSPGAKFVIRLQLTIAPLYEIYPLDAPPPPRATQLKLTLPDGWEVLDDWTRPETTLSSQPDGHSVYVGGVTFECRVRVSANAPPGPADVVCHVIYQACDARRCLRPAEVTLGGRVAIE